MKVPVTGSVLRWAREQSGLNLDELAESLDVTPDVVLAWEDEDEHPNKGQVKKLASKLGRPAAAFLLPEPPQVTAMTPVFRAALEQQRGRGITQPERKAVALAQRLQHVSRQLHDLQDTPTVPLPQAGSNSQAEQIADQAREFLGWTIRKQTETPNKDTLTKTLIALLENAGISVMLVSMSHDGARGFALWDDVAPVIGINTAQIPVARTFTLIHELGHLVRRDTAITPAGSTHAVERWCEQFAAAFLLPEDAVRQEARRRLGAQAAQSISDVTPLANHFRVSVRAMALRLQDLGLGVAGLYRAVDLAAEYRPRKETGGGGGGETRPFKRARELGSLYPRRLLRAEERGDVSHYDTLRLLRVNDADLGTLRALVTSADD